MSDYWTDSENLIQLKNNVLNEYMIDEKSSHILWECAKSITMPTKLIDSDRRLIKKSEL